MKVGIQRLALIGGGGFSKEIAEVAQLRGYTVEATYSNQPAAQVGRYRGYLDELLADRAEYDGVALAVGGVGRAAIQARAEIIHSLARPTCSALPSPSVASCDCQPGRDAGRRRVRGARSDRQR